MKKNKSALPQHYAIRAADQMHVCTVDAQPTPDGAQAQTRHNSRLTLPLVQVQAVPTSLGCSSPAQVSFLNLCGYPYGRGHLGLHYLYFRRGVAYPGVPRKGCNRRAGRRLQRNFRFVRCYARHAHLRALKFRFNTEVGFCISFTSASRHFSQNFFIVFCKENNPRTCRDVGKGRNTLRT